MKYTFLIIFLLASCKPSSSSNQLKIIPKAEIAKKVKAGTFNYLYATFLNQDGSPISDADRALLNKGALGKDYYEDNEGNIKEIRVRPITIEDKLIDIQRIEIASNPLAQINIIDINCEELTDLYEKVHQTDQDVRTQGGDMQSVDQENLQIVISAITKCGWSDEYLQTIWLVFQHSDADIMAYFYSDLKSFAEQGKLSQGSMALMEDRLLMYHGYKQIYGSQITNGGLYDLENPDDVNARRAAIGLGSIEEYTEHWGLDFAEEKARMATLE